MHTRTGTLPETYRAVTVGSGIRSSLARNPLKIALSCGERVLTYAALVDRIDRVSTLVRDAFKLAIGNRIAICAQNCLEYIEIVTGASDAGLCVAQINPKLSAAEIGFILNDCGARAVFVTPQTEVLVRAADCPALERIVVIGPEYDDLLARVVRLAERLQVDEWQAFSMPYTSGTTGNPRGVTLPHRSRTMTFFGMASEYGCYGPDDHYLATAPLFHGAGYSFAHAAIFFGGSCEILTGFDPETVITKLHETRASGTFMVPTHFHGIFGLEKKILEKNRGVHLKGLVSNAAALPQRTKELIVNYFGDGILHETYGSTEAAIVTNLRPVDQLRKQQCVGQPFTMNDVKLLDEQGLPVKTGEIGELYSNSPYLFLGYWNKPEATAAGFRDGWFTAGDLARMDDEGFIYLVDRKKDMFISGGVNVYPREIEEVLFTVPGIRDAAVVGMPDDYWGEVGHAFVVLQSGATMTAENIAAACKDRLAGFKIPKRVSFIDVLPRNAAGKVLKTELRKPE